MKCINPTILSFLLLCNNNYCSIKEIKNYSSEDNHKKYALINPYNNAFHNISPTKKTIALKKLYNNFIEGSFEKKNTTNYPKKISQNNNSVINQMKNHSNVNQELNNYVNYENGAPFRFFQPLILQAIKEKAKNPSKENSINKQRYSTENGLGEVFRVTVHFKVGEKNFQKNFFIKKPLLPEGNSFESIKQLMTRVRNLKKEEYEVQKDAFTSDCANYTVARKVNADNFQKIINQKKLFLLGVAKKNIMPLQYGEWVTAAEELHFEDVDKSIEINESQYNQMRIATDVTGFYDFGSNTNKEADLYCNIRPQKGSGKLIFPDTAFNSFSDPKSIMTGRKKQLRVINIFLNNIPIVKKLNQNGTIAKDQDGNIIYTQEDNRLFTLNKKSKSDLKNEMQKDISGEYYSTNTENIISLNEKIPESYYSKIFKEFYNRYFDSQRKLKSIMDNFSNSRSHWAHVYS